MKTIKTNKIIILLFFFFIGSGIQTTQAQFWKKLKKRVKDGVEEAILRKTEEKSVEKTENTIDSVFAIDKMLNRMKKTNMEDIALPESYDFEWKYVLKMESKETRKKEMGTMEIVYYLNPNSSTFGSKFKMSAKNGEEDVLGHMILILDSEVGAQLILMDLNDHKVIQIMPSTIANQEDEDSLEDEMQDYEIVKTDTKTILGYHCQGFRFDTDQGTVNIYIAKDTPVSFNISSGENSKYNHFKGFDTKTLREFKNGLMMEMEFTSNKKKKHNMKMTCVALEQEPFSINLNEYKSFMGMGNE